MRFNLLRFLLPSREPAADSAGTASDPYADDDPAAGSAAARHSAACAPGTAAAAFAGAWRIAQGSGRLGTSHPEQLSPPCRT